MVEIDGHPFFTFIANDSLSKADSVPWIGTKVIITKHGSPLKGYVAVVKDVLRSQDTLSGLRTFVQLLHLDPSAPFKTAIVNYDDIEKICTE